jgi:hypothetical protein
MVAVIEGWIGNCFDVDTAICEPSDIADQCCGVGPDVWVRRTQPVQQAIAEGGHRRAIGVLEGQAAVVQDDDPGAGVHAVAVRRLAERS